MALCLAPRTSRAHPTQNSNSPKNFTSTFTRYETSERRDVIEIMARLRATSASSQSSKAGWHSRPTTSKKGSTMIEVNHLTKRYGKTVAVDQVSFKVEPGRSRIPRTKRSRQVDHHAHDSGP